MSVTHPRVVNVRERGAEWDVYVGRGPCPARGEEGRTELGNPFRIDPHDPADCMARYFVLVEALIATSPGFDAALRDLRGKVLGCWCKGRYPVCHAEVLARLADGEDLEAIRTDVMGRLEPKRDPQAALFGETP